ncbi:MAG: hypothetical protein FWG25_07560, partial [Promicromonosporaceae bacterium]|nr:hypothetical protein [Promicromonosporaceae bacterium]
NHFPREWVNIQKPVWKLKKPSPTFSSLPRGASCQIAREILSAFSKALQIWYTQQRQGNQNPLGEIEATPGIGKETASRIYFLLRG